MIAQTFGQCLGVLIEYGFSLSGSREIARYSNDKNKIGEIVGGVLGAKALMVIFAVILGFGIAPFFQIFINNNSLFLCSLIWGVVQSLSLCWYFQGTENMKVIASLEVAGKFLGLLGIFIFVVNINDGHKVLLVNSIAYILSLLVGYMMLFREVKVKIPNLILLYNTLKMGFSLFVYRITTSVYSMGNPIILGLILPVQYVGFFAGAEKICQIGVRLLNPISQALYPRMSYFAKNDPEKANLYACGSLLIMMLIGGILSVSIYFLSEILVLKLLGNDFAKSVIILKLMAIVPFLVSMNSALGMQWMLSLGLDRVFNVIQVFVGIFHVLGLVLIVRSYPDHGAPIVVVFSELLLLMSTIFVLKWYGKLPFVSKFKESGGNF